MSSLSAVINYPKRADLSTSELLMYRSNVSSTPQKLSLNLPKPSVPTIQRCKTFTPSTGEWALLKNSEERTALTIGSCKHRLPKLRNESSKPDARWRSIGQTDIRSKINTARALKAKSASHTISENYNTSYCHVSTPLTCLNANFQKATSRSKSSFQRADIVSFEKLPRSKSELSRNEKPGEKKLFQALKVFRIGRCSYQNLKISSLSAGKNRDKFINSESTQSQLSNGESHGIFLDGSSKLLIYCNPTSSHHSSANQNADYSPDHHLIQRRRSNLHGLSNSQTSRNSSDQNLQQFHHSSTADDLVALGKVATSRSDAGIPSIASSSGRANARAQSEPYFGNNSGVQNGSSLVSTNASSTYNTKNVSTTSSTMFSRPRHLHKISVSSGMSGNSQASNPNTNSKGKSGSRNNTSDTYIDPISGAQGSFTQRLQELVVLEGETIKYERQRKLGSKRRLKFD